MGKQERELRRKKDLKGSICGIIWVQNQTLQIMSVQDVKQSLFETDLNFDSGMANEVYLFLTQNGIEVNKRNIYLQTVSAAAIISEGKLLHCKDTKEYIRYGTTIETVMSHLNGYSKEQFIETLQYMISKNSTLYQKLSSKIKHVEHSYRLFKKYRKSFIDLWQHTGINSIVMNDFLSIFWIIYLLVKVRKEDAFQDFSKQVKLLIVLTKSIFEYWISCVPQGVVKLTIQRNFNVEIQNFIDEQFFLLHHVELFNQAQKLYSIRYEKQTLDFKRFSKNGILIARFLDDISNYFYQERQGFEIENYIDEISYLELRNELIPQRIKKEVESDVPLIKLAVGFSSSQKDSKSQDKKQNHNELNIPVLKQTNHYIIAQNLSEMTPLRDRKDNLGITPCTNRIINLEWVRNCLDYMRRSDANPTFNRVFNFVQKQSLIDFQFKARKQLFYLVQEFTPKCLRKQNRVNDMLAFFKYIIIKIYQDHDQAQNAQMFREVKTFNAILCLSCDIFNFAYSSVITSYRKVCEIFEVPLIEALKPINWIGKNVDKPSELNTYLYALEKRIVIKEIWEDETGYNLLKSQQKFNQSSSIGYNDMIVWRRLIKHIFDRVEELSREVKLQHKLTKRIQNLIETILKQKPFLLHKNKIDQIIICCMTSFLSINQLHQQKTLQKVFKDYNRMDLSFNENREGLLADGREMTLSEFYNQVFLPEIQDIVDKNLTETDFLLTPIRQSYHQKISTNEGLITPFTKKYPENQIDGGQTFRPVELTNSCGLKLEGISMFKKQKVPLSPEMYRARQFFIKPRLILQHQKMQEDEEQKSKISSGKMSEQSDGSDESGGSQKSIENGKSEESEKSQKFKNSQIESENSMSDEDKSKENVEMIKEEKEEIQNEIME